MFQVVSFRMLGHYYPSRQYIALEGPALVNRGQVSVKAQVGLYIIILHYKMNK